MESVQARLQDVREKISRAAIKAGRDPAEVHLVVVTKSHPVGVVRIVLEAGAVDIGENYAEEALEKMDDLKQEFPSVCWHMIGHVQSRKAALVARHFSYLHSLDSLKLARRLDRFAGEAGRVLPVLLEYNVGGEASKFGWQAWNRYEWPAFLPDVEAIIKLPNLQLRGLMAMAPFTAPGEAARPYFQTLTALRAFLAKRFPDGDWSQLSMGMSQDYEVGVEEGATLVRVGQAILGDRKGYGGSKK